MENQSFISGEAKLDLAQQAGISQALVNHTKIGGFGPVADLRGELGN